MTRRDDERTATEADAGTFDRAHTNLEPDLPTASDLGEPCVYCHLVIGHDADCRYALDTAALVKQVAGLQAGRWVA